LPNLTKLIIPKAPSREISYLKNVLKVTFVDQLYKNAWFDFNNKSNNYLDKKITDEKMFEGNKN